MNVVRFVSIATSFGAAVALPAIVLAEPVPDSWVEADRLFRSGDFCAAAASYERDRRRLVESFGEAPERLEDLTEAHARCGNTPGALRVLELGQNLLPRIADETRRHEVAERFATRRALLESRRVVVTVPHAEPDLVVRLNGRDVTGRAEAFVEPRTYCVDASAPGKRTWVQCGTALPGRQEVTVPALGHSGPIRWEILVPVSAAVVGTAASIAWYVAEQANAESAFEDYARAIAEQKTDEVKRARTEVEDARHRRDIARTVATGAASLTVGALLTIGAWWLLDEREVSKARPRAAASASVAPRTPGSDAAIDVTVSFSF